MMAEDFDSDDDETEESAPEQRGNKKKKTTEDRWVWRSRKSIPYIKPDKYPYFFLTKFFAHYLNIFDTKMLFIL